MRPGIRLHARRVRITLAGRQRVTRQICARQRHLARYMAAARAMTRLYRRYRRATAQRLYEFLATLSISYFARSACCPRLSYRRLVRIATALATHHHDGARVEHGLPPSHSLTLSRRAHTAVSRASKNAYRCSRHENADMGVRHFFVSRHSRRGRADGCCSISSILLLLAFTSPPSAYRGLRRRRRGPLAEATPAVDADDAYLKSRSILSYFGFRHGREKKWHRHQAPVGARASHRLHFEVE